MAWTRPLRGWARARAPPRAGAAELLAAQLRALYRRQVDVPMALSEAVVDEMLVRPRPTEAAWAGVCSACVDVSRRVCGAQRGRAQSLERELPANLRLSARDKAQLETSHCGARRVCVWGGEGLARRRCVLT